MRQHVSLDGVPGWVSRQTGRGQKQGESCIRLWKYIDDIFSKAIIFITCAVAAPPPPRVGVWRKSALKIKPRGGVISRVTRHAGGVRRGRYTDHQKIPVNWACWSTRAVTPPTYTAISGYCWQRWRARRDRTTRCMWRGGTQESSPRLTTGACTGAEATVCLRARPTESVRATPLPEIAGAYSQTEASK